MVEIGVIAGRPADVRISPSDSKIGRWALPVLAKRDGKRLLNADMTALPTAVSPGIFHGDSAGLELRPHNGQVAQP